MGETREFDGKVAIVTGAAGGIGGAVARSLASDGVRVAVVDIDQAGAERVAADIVAAGDEAIAVVTDLGDEGQIVAMVATIVEQLGGIDFLDNNAALTTAAVLARDTSVTDMDVDVWDQMMSINLRSQMLTCKHAIPVMISRGGGSVVNMSSGAALSGDTTRTAYSVSKSGITTLTKALATQYGRQGVRANAIFPGLILTDPVRAQIPPAMLETYAASLLTPYVGEPRDVADLVSFLFSSRSRYITGQSISIDGGMGAHTGTVAS